MNEPEEHMYITLTNFPHNNIAYFQAHTPSRKINSFGSKKALN